MQSKNRRVLLVCTLIFVQAFCCFRIAQAQDWAVFNPLRQYNYAVKGAMYPEFCVSVDSFSVSDSDTIFYLNKIIREWDDGPYQDNEPVYYQHNQSHFLQDSVYETDSSFVFSGVENFEILKYTGNEDSWDIDTKNTIQAHYIDADTMTLFGQTDSVVAICLSIGDTILLSKSFGIVRFDPIYEDMQYILLGVENVTGSQTYNYRDIYDFNVGDVFEYEWDRFDPGGSRDGFYRTKILERNESENDISYVLLVNEVSLDYWEYQETQSKYTSTVTYSFEKDAPEDALPGQMVDLRLIGYDCEGYGEVFQVGFADSLLYGNIKYIDNNFFACKFVEDKPDLLQRVESEWGEGYRKACAPGLGIVFFHFFCFEQEYDMRLRAYRKNGISYGTFKPDYIYLKSEERIQEQGISIYPNPATSYTTVSYPQELGPCKISILDIRGSLVISGVKGNTLNLESLDAGCYFVVLEFPGQKEYRELVIR